MSRINFSDLPLSADQARAARNYFAWSQSVASERSGLPAHKLKRFESGNYLPDESFLADLRAFYERSGYTFDDTQRPGSRARETGLVFPSGVIGDDGEQPTESHRPAKASFHHMRIALADDREMGELLDMIEANEEKVQEILRLPFESGLFGGIAEATKKRHAQAVRLMADNGVMFARLFGREIGGKPVHDVITGKKAPATGAELLHRVQGNMHLASTGDLEAKERHKAKSTADSVLDAIGLS